MAYNPALSRQVVSYVDPKIHERMKRLQRSKPRLTLSRQIVDCLEAHLPVLERQAGFKARTPITQ